jgi:hypothetical protein
MDDTGAADQRALAALPAVRFYEGTLTVGDSVTWCVGCDALRDTDATWQRPHDRALLEALRALAALGGLPSGVKARRETSWSSAESALLAIKEVLLNCLGDALQGYVEVKLERAHGHACEPGLDSDGCRQVRVVRVSRIRLRLATRCSAEPQHGAARTVRV